MPARLKAVIGVRGGLATLRFDVAAARPASNQRRVLMRIIRKNEDTEFGREHGFSSIRTDDDFRRRVPIQEYEGFRPYVNRIIAGEKKILTVEDPHMLTLSSGTTGDPKIVKRDGASLDAVARNVATATNLSPGDRVLSMIPLCHSYGVEHGILAPTYAGCAVHCCRGFDTRVGI